MRSEFHRFPADLRIFLGTPQLMAQAHHHADIEMNFLLSGSMRYFMGGCQQVVEEGELGLFWAGTPHRLIGTRAGPQGCRCIWVIVPLAWFLGWELAAGFRGRLFRGELLRTGAGPGGEEARRDRLLLEGWERDLRCGRAEFAKVVALEVEARVRRMALATRPARAPRSARSADTGTPAERMAAHISEHFHQELSVGEIAAAAGLHPNYAMNLFRRASGMSLHEYLTRLRVSHAQMLLATTSRKLVEIALASGFGSASRFYDCFRRLAGLTPRQYRMKARAEA